MGEGGGERLLRKRVLFVLMWGPWILVWRIMRVRKQIVRRSIAGASGSEQIVVLGVSWRGTRADQSRRCPSSHLKPDPKRRVQLAAVRSPPAAPAHREPPARLAESCLASHDSDAFEGRTYVSLSRPCARPRCHALQGLRRSK